MIWMKQGDGSYAYYTMESAKEGKPIITARLVGSRWLRTNEDGECVSFKTLSELKHSVGRQN